jgi:hypothetical protein
MGLVSTYAAMCAALHAVTNFTATLAPDLYRITGRYNPGRFTYTTDFPVTLKMIGITPPALMALQFTDRPALLSPTAPENELTAVIIDCGGAESFLGCTSWYQCVSIRYWSFNRQEHIDLKWAHVCHKFNQADSIGMYVPPFAG